MTSYQKIVAGRAALALSIAGLVTVEAGWYLGGAALLFLVAFTPRPSA